MFIELTGLEDNKIVINVDFIQLFIAIKGGTKIWILDGTYNDSCIEVKEDYKTIKKMLDVVVPEDIDLE